MVVNWPATTQFTAPKSLCQSLCQRPPRRPVLPVFPTYKAFAVNNLRFSSFHGMEEVIGSIPIRSTNYLNNLWIWQSAAPLLPMQSSFAVLGQRIRFFP